MDVLAGLVRVAGHRFNVWLWPSAARISVPAVRAKNKDEFFPNVLAGFYRQV